MAASPRDEIARVFREECGRAVATLIRLFGDLDIAEEAVQEAFVVATRRWPAAGVPPNPGAWITTTARNKAIDRLRREGKRHDRHAASARLQPDDPVPPVGAVTDDRLRLIFTCCHPALARPVQVALTLRLLGGLQTPEIARAEVDGPAAGLAATDDLRAALDGYQPYHAIRADLLRRAGRVGEAGDAYRTALALADNAAERRFLAGRLQALA